MIVEIIATTLSEAKMAEQAGADRIELITAFQEGGLTPSYGLIASVVKELQIPVNVMVRPHSYSFVYGQDDLYTMREDIRTIRELGAAGIVIGCLTPERKIDIAALEALLEEAKGLDVTFHRAFDEAADLLQAVDVLTGYPQINRVLTSGGKTSALDAISEISVLVEKTKGTQLSILAGSGLTVESLAGFIEQTGVTEVHFGSGVRYDQDARQPIDPQKIESIKKLGR
ncbi:copper homeostasis protein CutC [Brevibacillus migulae]|uniref:copper homeostasis protein CutC n=1 Tax=Brevibacillus migulae TaxID=1644114 RepID=UPI00106EC8A1|nr:copper homeostasis protein CutC [Brevibacillus migulae]